MDRPHPHRLTYEVHLAGGRERLVDLILYISNKYSTAARWGKTKLNKILWRADFTSFLERGVPVSGRPYQRLRNGPAPVEMAPVLGRMVADRLINIEMRPQGSYAEERIVPLTQANMRYFGKDDIRYVDGAIQYYWDSTATEASDDSHGVAWASREDGDPMPYELAYLSNKPLSSGMLKKLEHLGNERGWKSE
jgi:hypothetical protein